MKLEIRWSNEFLSSLSHWGDGATISAAVMRFAETGDGDLRRVETPDGIEARLYAGGLYARLDFSAVDSVLYALRAFKATAKLRLVSAEHAQYAIDEGD